MAVRSTVIADEFITLAALACKSFTQMQLQKLVYFSHGWSLSLLKQDLTEDSPQAWPYGPVYVDLWKVLKHCGKSEVKNNILDPDEFKAERSKLSENQNRVIRKVFELYGDYHAFQLSAMTHKEGTPWHQVYVEEGRERAPISNDLIRAHFDKLAAARS